MKKTICAVVLCALVLSLALAGCGGGGNSGLAGTEWTLSSVEANGIKVEGDTLSQFGSASIKFEANSFSMSINEQSATGTYTMKDKTLTLTVDGEDATATMEDDGTLKLKLEDTMYMTFSKK